MSTSLLELIEAAGFNPRNPDDAIRLTAILNDEGHRQSARHHRQHHRLDYTRQRVNELTEQLGELSTGSEDREERQNLLDEIKDYQQTIDEPKEGEKL